MFSFARLATVFFILGYFGYLGPVRGWSCGELTQATTNPCTGQVQLALALVVVDIELASVAHLFARTFVSVLAATQFVNLGRKLVENGLRISNRALVCLAIGLNYILSAIQPRVPRLGSFVLSLAPLNSSSTL